jgi:hypothetical protein
MKQLPTIVFFIVVIFGGFARFFMEDNVFLLVSLVALIMLYNIILLETRFLLGPDQSQFKWLFWLKYFILFAWSCMVILLLFVNQLSIQLNE